MEDGYDPVPLELLRAEGLDVDEDELCRAKAWAIDSYSESFTSTVLWALVEPDAALHRRLAVRSAEYWRSLPAPSVRPGLVEAAARLAAAGFRLRLATKYDSATREKLLAHHRLEGFFSAIPDPPHPKPDVRFYTWLVEEVEPGPRFKAMVGDDLVCDIAPAKRAGLTAIRLRVGNTARLRPRTPDETPDRECAAPAEVADAVFELSRYFPYPARQLG